MTFSQGLGLSFINKIVKFGAVCLLARLDTHKAFC